MSEKEDKKVDAKVEAIDLGYKPPPPEMGPVSPYPPGYWAPGPAMPCPYVPDMMTEGLAAHLRKLVGQQVTVYTTGLGTAALTGILQDVGMNYLKMSVIVNEVERIVYVPMHALNYVVPGGPLEPPTATVVTTTTLPGAVL